MTRVSKANDFRSIALAKLLCYEQVSAHSLTYLLHAFPLADIPVPTVVSGIAREKRGKIVCEGTITKVATGLRSQQQIQQYTYAYHGGVEVRIEFVPEQFTDTL